MTAGYVFTSDGVCSFVGIPARKDYQGLCAVCGHPDCGVSTC